MPPAIDKILTFYIQHRRMPSYSEMTGLLGYRSKRTIYRRVHEWIREGYLKKDSAGRIVPDGLLRSVRVLGTVEAGWPSPAEEELVDTMSLDEFLIQNKEATFILKVKGDSMKDAGILPGDMLLVERGRTAKNGDIVIAEVDREWTAKYFRKKGNKVYLEPANKKYKAIEPQEELKVAAVVLAVIRKYA